MKKNKENKLTKKNYEKLKAHLYSKKPLLRKGSPFSALLQNMVNKVLEGEMEDFESIEM